MQASTMFRRVLAAGLEPIETAVVYKGHRTPPFGCYLECAIKQEHALAELNHTRLITGLRPWAIISMAGEQLMQTLRSLSPRRTLLIMPAGESSKIEAVFSPSEKQQILDFLKDGGRAHFTCGMAYLGMWRRNYMDHRVFTSRLSSLPVTEGLAEGPLIPYRGELRPAEEFPDGLRVTTEAVRVTDGEFECDAYVGGGGVFRLPTVPSQSGQQVRPLAWYVTSEIRRLRGPGEKDPSRWKIAAILASVKAGGVLKTMFHLEYGPDCINPEVMTTHFPDDGTNWRKVREKLEATEHNRLLFLGKMYGALEALEFPPPKASLGIPA